MNAHRRWSAAAAAVTLLAAVPSAPERVAVEPLSRGAAARAGLRAGDVLLAPAHLLAVYELEARRAAVGTADVSVQRGSDTVRLSLEPGDWRIVARTRDAEPGNAEAAHVRAAEALELRSRPLHAAAEWLSASRAAYAGHGRERAARAFDRALAALARDPAGAAYVAVLWEKRGRDALARWDIAAAETAWDAACAARRARSASDVAYARCLIGRGDAALLRRDLGRASEAFESARALAVRLAPGTLLEADALRALGLVALERRDLEAAESALRRARTLAAAVSTPTDTLAESLRGLAVVAMVRGDAAAAEAAFAEARTAAVAFDGGGVLSSRAQSGLGIVAWRVGRLVDAERHFTEALAIAEREAPNTVLAAGYLNNLGLVHYARFDFHAARRAYERALAAFVAVSPDSLEVARARMNVALAAGRAGDPVAAVRELEQVLATQQRHGAAPADIAQTYESMGANLLRANRPADAERAHREALTHWAAGGTAGLSRAASTANLAHALRAQGRHAEARRWYDETIAAYARLAPGSTGEADALHGRGMVAAAEQDLPAARAYLARAIAAFEAQEGELGGTVETHAGFAGSFEHLYKDYATLLRRAGDDAGAFRLLEAYRARLFLAMLGARPSTLDAGLSEPLRAVRQRLRTARDQARGRLSVVRERNAPAADIEAVMLELRRIDDERAAFIARVRAESPRAAAVHYPDALSAESVAGVLPPDAALVTFAVGAQSSEAYVLRRGRAGANLTSVELAVGGADLGAAVDAWRVLLQSRSADAGALRATDARGHELYRRVLLPIEPLLAGARRLVIVPDGPLQLAPFAALVTRPSGPAAGAAYLGNRFVVQIAPSGTTYARLRRATRRVDDAAPLELVAFADPVPAEGAAPAVRRGGSLGPLPHARAEAQAIAALFAPRAERYVGAAASERRVKSLAPMPRALHFAVHAVLDDFLPLDSALVLAPDGSSGASDNGLLQAWEVLDQLPLDADLVTLSSCSSALSPLAPGQGALGLTGAFHAAGARAVVASLWAVDDASTAELMQHFYGRIRAGADFATALAGAQQDLRRETRWAHPFHWAGFQVSGYAVAWERPTQRR